ncbi:hypothetical protein AHiyo8_17190 [Arthrobacter sp. Hiyo8]|nr:hypothetical protein AHiyo8_17190 [Arthrobacter sp. Hiyo8]
MRGASGLALAACSARGCGVPLRLPGADLKGRRRQRLREEGWFLSGLRSLGGFAVSPALRLLSCDGRSCHGPSRGRPCSFACGCRSHGAGPGLPLRAPACSKSPGLRQGPGRTCISGCGLGRGLHPFEGRLVAVVVDIRVRIFGDRALLGHLDFTSVGFTCRSRNGPLAIFSAIEPTVSPRGETMSHPGGRRIAAGPGCRQAAISRYPASFASRSPVAPARNARPPSTKA